LKFLKISPILLLFLGFACNYEKKIVQTREKCKTKYPVIFVHGIAYRDDVGVLPYWSHIPKVLRKHGAKVYLSHTQAFNSHIDNSILLKYRILDILETTGAEKVNIIAHSKGGLEARWMISRLNMADKVASLSTIASPHKGSSVADSILKTLKMKGKTRLVVKIVEFYASAIGDREPNVLEAAENLTVEYMNHFNGSVPKMENVYYQSYGCVMNPDYPLKYLLRAQNLLSEKEGDNDSQVSIESAKYDNFILVESPDGFGLSHFDIAGMRFISKSSSFDAEKFYIDIVNELKNSGF
jgi:triacylglycerol lipase